jgi:phosphoribosylformimino-5-aminoimidazole carboxamide ribotide isomerase
LRPRVIPVIDLRAGQTVHARGGRRDAYEPVRSTLCDSPDPLALAAAYRDTLGLTELYVADLDAIDGNSADIEVLRRLVGLGLRVWVDAGVAEIGRWRAMRAAGVDRVIVATETLPSPAALRELAGRADPDTLVFGLDLRGGRPLLRPGASWPSAGPLDLIGEAVAAGLRRLLILDLARVGSGQGVAALEVAEGVAQRHPGAEILVGGGLSGPGDLDDAARAGVEAVLVGSALHDGRIRRADLRHRDARGSGSHSRSTSAD